MARTLSSGPPSRRLFRALLLACACLGSGAWGQQAPASLVLNGDFEQDADRDGWADGWRKHPNAAIQREAGNAWLVLNGSYATSAQPAASSRVRSALRGPQRPSRRPQRYPACLRLSPAAGYEKSR